MKANLISLLLGVALLAGCAATDTNKSGSEARPTAQYGNVVLLFSKPDRKYVELGTVSTTRSRFNQVDTPQNTLRRQANAMGADAVIIDPSTFTDSTVIMLSGTAIRYVQ